ncbi:MAG: LPS export ABC transporter permease LptF [Lysobacterales bacterium]
MSIADRYLLKVVSLTWLGVLVVLLCVTVGLAVGDTLADVARGRVPSNLLLTQLGLKTIEGSTILLPLSLFLGIILAFGRLYRDQELTVLAACGMGQRSLYRSLSWLTVPLLLVMVVLSVWVSPWALRTSKSLLAAAASEMSVSGLQEGRFHEFASGDSVVYVASLQSDGKFGDAFIHVDRDGRKDIVTADSGFQYRDASGARYLALLDGERSEGVPGAGDYRWMTFARNDIRLPDPAEQKVITKFGALPIAQVLAGETPHHHAEFHWRLAPVVALAVLVLLAVPLSRTTPRRGYFGNLVMAIMIYVIYANLLAIGTAWLEADPGWRRLGLWWVHASGIGLALWLLRNRHRRLGRRTGAQSA